MKEFYIYSEAFEYFIVKAQEVGHKAHWELIRENVKFIVRKNEESTSCENFI